MARCLGPCSPHGSPAAMAGIREVNEMSLCLSFSSPELCSGRMSATFKPHHCETHPPRCTIVHGQRQGSSGPTEKSPALTVGLP